MVKKAISRPKKIFGNKSKHFAGTDWDGLIQRTGTAPIIPKVNTPNDTSNFDPYPDSVEEAPIPVYSGKDPFTNF